MHGEAEAAAVTNPFARASGAASPAAAYHDDLVALVGALRRDLRCPELPVVCAHVLPPAGPHAAVG